MTDDKRQAQIAEVRNKLGLPPDVRNKLGFPHDVDEGLYEADTAEETDTTEQADASTPKYLINIDSDDDNDNNDEDQDDINADIEDDGEFKDNNTLHPRTARKQGCAEREEESLFFKDSDDDHDCHYSESSDNESKKKKKSRRTPKSTIRTPKKTHWSGNRFSAAQEAATVLVAIGATCNVAKFVMADGLDEIAEIQKFTRETLFLYAKNSRNNLSVSDIVSTRFILDLEKAVFKMIDIKNRISRVIDPADIDKKWCCA